MLEARNLRCVVMIVMATYSALGGFSTVAAHLSLSVPQNNKTYQFINGRWCTDKGFHPKMFYSVDGRLTRTKPQTEEDAKLAAKNGVTVVTTTRLSHTWHGGEHAHASGHDQEKVLLLSAIEEHQKQNLRLLHQHGVKLAIGSDHDETSVPEAMNLHRLGVFNNQTLLKMWTEATPQAIFPGRQIGHLKDGYEASFLVLQCNPIENFACVEHIRLRVKQGSVINVSSK